MRRILERDSGGNGELAWAGYRDAGIPAGKAVCTIVEHTDSPLSEMHVNVLSGQWASFVSPAGPLCFSSCSAHLVSCMPHIKLLEVSKGRDGHFAVEETGGQLQSSILGKSLGPWSQG